MACHRGIQLWKLQTSSLGGYWFKVSACTAPRITSFSHNQLLRQWQFEHVQSGILSQIHVHSKQEWRLYRWGKNEDCTDEERMKAVPMKQEWRLYRWGKNEDCTDEERMKAVPMRQEWRLYRWGKNEDCTDEERMKTVPMRREWRLPMRVVTKEPVYYNVVAVLWLGEAISRHYRI